jgi:N-acyl-D-amino-acid deacylase
MLNQYPYAATSTGIAQLLPAWALAGGDSALRRRLASPPLRDSVKRGVIDILRTERGGGDLHRIQLAQVGWAPELEGKTLHDWAVARGLAPTPAAGAELALEAVQRGGAAAIYHLMEEGDVERIMRHPQTMIASDGQLTRPGDARPHPRAYGTFPRVLGHYVRERRVLSLEDAVRKMTAMPAARLGLRDRGLVAEGRYADLIVFDPARVTDRATYAAPHQYPEGIDYVVVNGVVTVDGGRGTVAHGGRLLRRRAAP